MHRRANALAAALMAGVMLSCSGRPEAASPLPDIAGGMARSKVARAALLKAWDDLDSLRNESESLASRQPPTPAVTDRINELENRLTRVQAAFDAAYNADQAALADVLNSVGNSAVGPEAIVALNLCAESAMRYARDVIDHSGDYRRAIGLLDTARGYFDDLHAAPPRALTDALQLAREYRLITRARFDRLATGMTGTQVRALVGVPFSGNVHRSKVDGNGVTSWLYGSEDNSVAALYFDDRGMLYAWKWNVMGGN